jgi:hypothetical protein
MERDRGKDFAEAFPILERVQREHTEEGYDQESENSRSPQPESVSSRSHLAPPHREKRRTSARQVVVGAALARAS